MKAPSPVLSPPNPASSRPSQAVTPRPKVGPGATVGDTGYGVSLFTPIWRRLGRCLAKRQKTWVSWARLKGSPTGSPHSKAYGAGNSGARPGYLSGALGAPGRGVPGAPAGLAQAPSGGTRSLR